VFPQASPVLDLGRAFKSSSWLPMLPDHNTHIMPVVVATLKATSIPLFSTFSFDSTPRLLTLVLPNTRQSDYDHSLTNETKKIVQNFALLLFIEK